MGRPSHPTSAYLDSCVLIDAIQEREGHETVTELLKLGAAGKLALHISTLSLVEVRGQANDSPFDEATERQVLAQIDHPRLVPIEFDRSVALIARRLARTEQLKNPDAIHLASAISAGVDVFMTRDSDFKDKDKAKGRGRRLGCLVDGVWVDRPYLPGDPDPCIPGL